MMKKFEYKNVMQVPKLEKIVINMGIGEAKDNAKLLEAAAKDLEIISGQEACNHERKKSVANFKLREGMPMDASYSQGAKMYEFLDRLVNLRHFPVYVTSEE
jgi:large subunit ribosomal protein L5